MNPDRGYNPPDSTLDDLKHLHKTLGVDRVVFTQPSTYGTDNSAILDGMTALNAETPNRARCVVAITMDITDKELGSARQAGRARRAAQHRQQGRHAGALRPDRRARGAHPAVRLALRVAVPRQGHRRADAGAQEREDPAVDRPLRLSAGEGHDQGAGLPGAARPDEGRQHLDEDFRRQPRQRHRPAALRRRHADGACADRGGARAHHVGHRLAASEQVRRQSERRRSGRLVRQLGAGRRPCRRRSWSTRRRSFTGSDLRRRAFGTNFTSPEKAPDTGRLLERLQLSRIALQNFTSQRSAGNRAPHV